MPGVKTLKAICPLKMPSQRASWNQYKVVHRLVGLCSAAASECEVLGIGVFFPNTLLGALHGPERKD